MQNLQTNTPYPNVILLGSERVLQRRYFISPVEEQHTKEEY